MNGMRIHVCQWCKGGGYQLAIDCLFKLSMFHMDFLPISTLSPLKEIDTWEHQWIVTNIGDFILILKNIVWKISINNCIQTTYKTGGERGIRTLGTISGTHDFQSCTFGHSVISPKMAWGQENGTDAVSGQARLGSSMLILLSDCNAEGAAQWTWYT